MSNGNFGWPDSSKTIQCQLDPKHTCLPDRIKIYLELDLMALARVVEYCGVARTSNKEGGGKSLVT